MRTTKALMLLLAVWLPAAAAPSEQPAESRVVEARPDALVVEQPGGLARIAVKAEVPVLYEGRPLELSSLAPGDRVRVTYRPGTSQPEAAQIVLLPRSGPAPVAVPLEVP